MPVRSVTSFLPMRKIVLTSWPTSSSWASSFWMEKVPWWTKNLRSRALMLAQALHSQVVLSTIWLMARRNAT